MSANNLHKKIYIIGLLLICSISLSATLLSASATQVKRAYGYQTEELIHNEPHFEGSKYGYVHFRSRANIEDVTGRLLSIHGLYAYASGVVTISEEKYWSDISSRKAYCEYHWHTSLFNNDYKTVYNQH